MRSRSCWLLEQLAAELQNQRGFFALRAESRAASQQARPLVEAQHDVEVLHRLIRRRPSPGCR